MSQTSATAPPTEYGFTTVGEIPDIILHGEYSRSEEIKLAAEALAEKINIPRGGTLATRVYDIFTTTHGAMDDHFETLKKLWGIPPVGQRYKEEDPVLTCTCGTP